MSQRAKGFTLVELLIAVSLAGILVAMAIPSFSSAMQSAKADTEVADLQRVLNYARLEAINRGVNIQVRPATDGTAWNTDLKVVPASNTNTVLRANTAMSSGATVTMPNGVTLIEFNNLGVLYAPSNPVAVAYARGTISKTVNVCLNGRVVLGGSC